MLEPLKEYTTSYILSEWILPFISFVEQAISTEWLDISADSYFIDQDEVEGLAQFASAQPCE